MAVPIYVQPEINQELGIALGIDTNSLKEVIKKILTPMLFF